MAIISYKEFPPKFGNSDIATITITTTDYNFANNSLWYKYVVFCYDSELAWDWVQNLKLESWTDGVTTKSGFLLLLNVMSSRNKGLKIFHVLILLCSVLWSENGRFCFTCFQPFLVCAFWYDQVVSDSLIFNFDLLWSFRRVFSFLSFKISASRNFNLLWSLLLPDFSHTLYFAFKLLIIPSTYFFKFDTIYIKGVESFITNITVIY